MPGNPKIAIVILNWNGANLFETYLPSVIENSVFPNTEIIVADNGSTDNSIGILNNKFPSVKILKLNTNYGFAGGYNKALEQVDADFYVILNSDVKVTPGWIETVLQVFIENENVAAIQPKILSYNIPNQFEYAGAAGGYIDKYGYPFCKGRLLNQIENDKGQYDTPAPIFWASGACMFVRSSCFKLAGGFDSDFWAHMEEIDLCWRLKNMGYSILYQPKSVVYHLGGGTLSYNSPLKIHLNFRNNLWMLYKNLPQDKFKRIFITRMFLDGIAALKFLADFHFTGFSAVLKAHVAFYKHRSGLKTKRKHIQHLVVTDNHREIYPQSIMWKFFLEKKRKFTDLNFNS